MSVVAVGFGVGFLVGEDGGCGVRLGVFLVIAVGFGMGIIFLVELVVLLGLAWNAVSIGIRVGQKVSFGGFLLSISE